ncbi:MAG: LrgB family protein [Alistipes senegalensis]|nr:LrgB family protein [Oxalobacter formigenes]MCM1281600.1 LrgB family protein [Alistipes senegalensis]
MHNDILYITLTIAVFWGAQWLQHRLGWILLNPVLLSVALLILILKAGHISYDAYEEGGRYIAFFLKPAIVALAVPLYRQFEQIKKQAVPVMASQLVACITGIVAAVLIAQTLGAPPEISLSLSPKSVTTPIAMEVARVLGGIPALTAVIVIVTGIFGAVIGTAFLKLIRVRSPIAQGLAMGAAAHAMGTAQVMKKTPKMGAYASVGLIINGILTGLLTPWLLQLIARLG